MASPEHHCAEGLTQSLTDPQTTIQFLHKNSVKYLDVDDERGVLIIPININGRHTNALLDTGMTGSTVDIELANELGAKKCENQGEIRTSFSYVRNYTVSELTIEVENQWRILSKFNGQDLSPLSNALGKPIGFVIGLDILGSMSFLVDAKNKKIAFAKSGSISSKQIPLAKLSIENGYVNGFVNSKKARAEIDLGSNNELLVYRSSWNYLFEGKNPIVIGNLIDGSGANVEARGLKDISMSFGGIDRFVDAKVILLDEKNADVLIGYEFFSERRTIFDYPAGEILIFE